jgi:hypothetical protein
MGRNTGLIAASALALALGWGGPSSAAAPPTSGTISIETEPGTSRPAFLNAIGQAFEDKGFTVLKQPGHAAFVAEIDIGQVEVGTGSARVPTTGSTVTPGDSPGSVGVGVRIPLPTGKSSLVPLERTRLEIRIHKRGEQADLWQGAAVTVRAAGTRKGQDAAVASDLAQAILRNYPAQPEGVIGVP